MTQKDFLKRQPRDLFLMFKIMNELDLPGDLFLMYLVIQTRSEFMENRRITKAINQDASISSILNLSFLIKKVIRN